MTAEGIIQTLQSLGSPEKAAHLSRFFKTGVGQYGEGDCFLGVVVPQTRNVAKANKATPLDEVQRLLDSPWHEAPADFGLPFPRPENNSGRTGGDLSILPEKYPPLQQLGFGRPLLSGCRRRIPRRPRPIHAVHIGSKRQSVGATHRHCFDLCVHPPLRLCRHTRFGRKTHDTQT